MADFVLKLKSTKPESLRRMEAVLRNPERILKQIGVKLLADAQKAFRNQEWDGEPWPARYPGQAPPYVNVAGVVADFIAGKSKPPARRFQNRPAGIDTGQTLRSLTAGRAISTEPFAVTVSSNTAGALAMSTGTTSTQLITKQVKERLAAWMRSARKRIKRRAGDHRQPTNEDSAAAKLGWLFSKKSLVTKSAPRPFLGLSKSSETEIMRITGGEFVKEADSK